MSRDMSTSHWWIEVSGPHASDHPRLKLHGPEFAIGRGYGNDLILDDPYVSPTHARLECDDEGHWWIEDLGSENGTLDARDERHISRVKIFEDATFTLGRTTLRFRGSASPVAATLLLEPQTNRVPTQMAGDRGWGVNAQATVMLLIATALSALSIWLKQTAEPKVANYFYGAIMLPLMVLGWSGIWALVTRILTHQAHFARHVRIATLAMLFLIFTDATFKVVDYAFAWVSASTVESMLNWVAAAAMVIAHIRVIAPHRFGVIAAIVGGLAVAALVLDYSMKSDRQKYQPPTIITSLLPPVFPTKPPVGRDALFERIGALKTELDEERKKDPPAGFNFLGDFD